MTRLRSRRWRPFARLVGALVLAAVWVLVASRGRAAEPDAPVATPPTAPSDGAGPVLDLEHAYDRALATDQSIRSAYEAVKEANLLPWSGLTRLGPRISATGEYRKPERNISSSLGPTLVETRSAELSIEQPLFDLTAIPAYKQGTLAADASRLSHRLTVRNTLFGVAQSYFEVLKQTRIVEVIDQTLELAEGQLTLARRRFEVGEVTKTDVLRAQVVVEQARERQIQAENDLRLARHTLASVLNLADSEPIAVTEPVLMAASVPRLDDAVRTAGDRREDLRAAKLAIEQREQAHHEVVAQYAPRVVGEWTDQWLDPQTFSARNDFWEATVSLEIPFFEGGQRELDLARTNLEVERERLAYEILAKSVDLEVRDAWLGVQTLTRTLEALRAQVAAAEENYHSLESQYRAGEATSLDLQSALTDLARARVDLTTSTFDLEVAHRNLERATGTFQDARVERVKLP